jgi:starvation-inducible DNA-binding protein
MKATKSTPHHLDAGARTAITTALRETLVDGIDLYTQTKVAHWNIKGPQFAALHPLFDTYATTLAGFVDQVAERILTLGELAVGTARHVAKNSRLEDYPQDVTRDLEHVGLLLARIEQFLAGAKAARAVADQHEDQDTADVLTQVIVEFEKNAWFLRSTLGR